MWEKEKMLVTSIFSISHNGFRKNFSSEWLRKSGSYGEEFTFICNKTVQNILTMLCEKGPNAPGENCWPLSATAVCRNCFAIYANFLLV